MRIAFLLLLVATSSNAAELIGLGVLYPSHPGSVAVVNGVSANGLVAVGYGQSNIANRQAFRWTEPTLAVPIGFLESSPTKWSEATAVSCDGSAIVGFASSAQGTQAFRWSQQTGMVPLGFLDSTPPQESRATAVSCDGTVVAGFSTSASGIQAFRYTTSMTGLGDLEGGGFESRAFGMSHDGNVIAGFSDSGEEGGNPEAFVWTPQDGMQRLGDTPGSPIGQYSSRAFAVSGQSTSLLNAVVAGKASGEQAFRWTWQNGLSGLGFNIVSPHPPGVQSFAHGINAAGTILIGYWTFFNNQHVLTSRAMIWGPNSGMHDLKTAVDPSVTPSVMGWTLTGATGISANGNVVVGNGKNPMDKSEPWLIRDTPPPSDPPDWEKTQSHIICCWQPPGPDPWLRVFDGSLSGTSPECRPLTSYEWSFGDGGKGTGEIGRHTYRAPGRYRVQLTVRDRCRGSAIDVVEVDVGQTLLSVP
jgi:probable HAF family extracellular repeat protein